jgi:hypothetical protein
MRLRVTVWDEGVESVGSYFDMMVMNKRRYCWHHHGHDGCRQAIFKGRRGIVLVFPMRWAQGVTTDDVARHTHDEVVKFMGG